MNYRKASIEDAEKITAIVQKTIAEIYPKYYPKEIVEFFAQLHCYENIVRDIKNNIVYIAKLDNVIIGTGSYEENHITRVYVLAQYQGKGYGHYILKELEKEIVKKYSCAVLDTSLPACKFYEGNGYKTVKHEYCKCDNKTILVYDVMEKQLK